MSFGRDRRTTVIVMMSSSGAVRLVLASASPRRSDLLSLLGVPFVVRAADLDETPELDEDPAAYVARLARAKALAVAEPGDLVIGADTTVVCDGAILGKPTDREDAVRMLTLLAGRAHDAITGVSVCLGEQCRVAVDTSRVTLLPMTVAEIDWYVQRGECHDKAGAYALQGIAGCFVARVEGSVQNVTGLPMPTVIALARQLGIDLLATRSQGCAESD